MKADTEYASGEYALTLEATSASESALLFLLLLHQPTPSYYLERKGEVERLVLNFKLRALVPR